MSTHSEVIDDVRRDAMRYRFLRSRVLLDPPYEWQPVAVLYSPYDGEFLVVTAEEIDRAVDAYMSAEGKK